MDYKRRDCRNMIPIIAVVLRDAESFRVDAVPVSNGLTMNLKTVCFFEMIIIVMHEGRKISDLNAFLRAGEGHLFRCRNGGCL